jgi:hydrogenase maturation protease
MGSMNFPHIAVLGLGNLMRTDDAVGMLAIQQLRADPRFPRSVSLIEGGTLGLDLLHPLDGVTHLLALDAIDAGAAPGTLLRFAGDEIADLPISKSVHLLGFSDLIGAARLTGSAPAEIIVLGVQPEIIGWAPSLRRRCRQPWLFWSRAPSSRFASGCRTSSWLEQRGCSRLVRWSR